MAGLTPGKLAGLKRISRAGHLTMVAMDQRGSMKKMMNKEKPDAVTDAQMLEVKRDLFQTLSKNASAILIDPQSFLELRKQGATHTILQKTGLLLSQEETGYEALGAGRVTSLLPDWGPGPTKNEHADAAKLLLYYLPDDSEAMKKQEELLKRVYEECKKHDLLFLLEPLSYSAKPDEKVDVVVETARRLQPFCDILKMEFPSGSTDATQQLLDCKRLNGIIKIPWVILSAGVDFDVFERQVELASRAGASGFLGGRAIWKESVPMPHEQRAKFLEETSTARILRLIKLVEMHGSKWFDKYDQ